MENNRLFDDNANKGPVECLGLTFSNDEDRRKYFSYSKLSSIELGKL